MLFRSNYFRFIPDFSQLVLIMLSIWILSIAMNWSEFVSSLGPRREEWKRMSYQFFRNPLAVFGLVIVTLLLLMALFAPILAPPSEAQLERDPMRMEENFQFNHNLQPPCIEWWSLHPLKGCTGERGEENGFILGSTNKGYDIYYGIKIGRAHV